MNFRRKVCIRPSTILSHVKTRLTLSIIAAVAGPSCVAPTAVGPHGLTIARPYQANPQIMTLTPVTIFRNQAGYLSYESSTRGDVAASSFVRRIRTSSCQSGIQLPYIARSQGYAPIQPGISVGLGEGTLQKTLDQATQSIEPGQQLSDFTLDLKTVSIFMIWRETCLVLTAAVTEPDRNDSASEVNSAAYKPVESSE